MRPLKSGSPVPFALGHEEHLHLSDLSVWLERRNKLVLAVTATLVHGLLYGLPNRIHLAPPVQLPMTWVDRAVPFIPQAFWLYLSDYLLVFVCFLLCRKPGSAARFIHAFMTVVAVATLVHWVWPTLYPREAFPVPADASPFMHWVVARFREVDSPASCMPSLHVATAFLSAFAVVWEGDRRAPALLAWAALIWASTLATKQHYLMDGIAGLLLALVVWALYYGSHPRPEGVKEVPGARIFRQGSVL